MHTIKTLPKTTFSGRRFTRKQLRMVRETVQMFKGLSRKELAFTICENLEWKTPNGKLKVDSAIKLLEALESYSIIKLPAKRKTKAPIRQIPAFDKHPESPPVSDTINNIGPISLQQIVSKEDRECWKAYLQTYHYLGYKQPFGAYIGYFIVSEARQQVLGCLLFSASATRVLAPRDNIIGWKKKHREKLLHLIIKNDRFLIFPWVNVPNLASQALSIATNQIRNDWLKTYAYCPVLIETFVDPAKYSGTCYQAANWQYIGKTKGIGSFKSKYECKKTKKDIYIYPLESDYRQTLTTLNTVSSLKKKYRNDLQMSNTRSVDDTFIILWENVVKVIQEIADEYDEKWQVRKRILNSMLLTLLIFRLVCSKNSQSYGTTIDELWDSCDKLNISLPQKSSIAPSSFCEARKKLDESIFKEINHKMITTYDQYHQKKSYRWLGHRIFAVDGSKVNLPRKLKDAGYSLPSKNANYPQGLLSCLYQIKSQIPFDFDLVSHADERRCAKRHLQVLKEDDIVVYDRGYFSYIMLHQHITQNIHAVFRLQENSFTVIKEFFSNSQTDCVVEIYPSKKTRYEIKSKHPNLEIVPIKMRLIKYTIEGNIYCIGTTLIDQNRYNSIQEFMELYHSRWGVEELYKISKRIFDIEDFHSKTERGVRQEIFAHFALITMNRIFANKTDDDLNQSNGHSSSIDNTTTGHNPSFYRSKALMIKTNFKNCIHIVGKNLEELLLLQTKMNLVIDRVYNFIIRHKQKVRPDRSYPRKSMRPETKWRPTKKKTKTQAATAPT